MFTPIFLPPIRVIKDPKCPNCKKTLRGRSEPDDNSTLTAIAIAVVILLQLTGAAGGFIEGLYHGRTCGNFLEKRIDYLVPLNNPACHLGNWFSK